MPEKDDMSKRDASAVMEHHVSAVATKDLDNVMSDYADNVIAINNLDGTTRTFRGNVELRGFIDRVLRMEIDPKMAEAVPTAIIRQSVGDYVVSAYSADPAIPFAAYTYITRNGKAVYVTGYQHTPDLKIPE